MRLAVKGNVRSANAALTSFKDAMETAFKAGGVSGMFTVGLGLLGATIIFLVFQRKRDEGANRLRLRRLARGALHARRRRHLHQGG